MANYKYIFEKRWALNEEMILLDLKYGQPCKGKLYKKIADQSVWVDCDELKFHENIDDYVIYFPSGEIWIWQENTQSLYGQVNFTYFGEKDNNEQKLFTHLVNDSLFGNYSSAIQLIKNLGRTFYLDSEIDSYDFSDIKLGDCYDWISSLMHVERLQFEFTQLGAFNGNPNSQYRLGSFYQCGNFVDRNEKTATGWYKKAAKQNYLPAMYSLYSLYLIDYRDHIKNKKKCFYWMNKSAKYGSPVYWESLGYWYKEGIGTAKNFKKAIYWFKKICNLPEMKIQNCCRNFGEILYNLGLFSFYGLGTQKNINEAYEYFRKSADQGFKEAYDALAYIDSLHAE